MKMFTPCLVCLLSGLAAGYGLRPWVSPGEDAASTPVRRKTTAPDNTAKNSPATTPASVKDSAPAKAVDKTFEELLVDYDTKSAQKAAAKMDVAKIQSSLSMLASQPRTSQRDALRAVLYAAWGAKDLQGAWKAVLADPLDTRGSLAGSVAAVLAKTDPVAALDLVRTMGMGGKRSSAMGTVMSAWSKQDVSAAISYALEHPELMTGYQISFTSDLTRLAQADPLKAAGLALRFKDETRRSSMLVSLMDGWIEKDSTSAFDWALAQTNPKLRQEAVTAAVAAWSKIDPKAALAYVATIPDGVVRGETFKKAWTDWFKIDPLAATDHLVTIKDERMLADARFGFSYYSEGYTTTERGQLLARLPDGTFKQSVMDSMSDRSIRQGNYRDAVEMLNALPDSYSRDRNVFKLGMEWAKNDPSAVSQWVKTMPDSSDRDLAVAGYARTLARSDPAAAISEAVRIPDPKVRKGALSNIADIWLRTDPTSARAWLATEKNLSDIDRKMIEMHSRIGSSTSDTITIPVSVGRRR